MKGIFLILTLLIASTTFSAPVKSSVSSAQEMHRRDGGGHGRDRGNRGRDRRRRRRVHRTCYVSKYGARGRFLRTFVGRARGRFRTRVMRRACRKAMRRCQNTRVRRQYCRRD